MNGEQTIRDSAVARWGVLVLISGVMFMNYYFYDALSPLKDLMQSELGFTSADYGFFTAAYSIPNVFLLMAVIGGIICDRLGIRITGFTFCFFMAIGGVVTAYGATEYFNNGGFGHTLMASFLPSFSVPRMS